jgi:glycerol kinase
MLPGLILAIDQGTTNTKALLVGRSGVPVFRASSPLGLIHSTLGFVEQNPRQLWDSCLQAIAKCTAYASETDKRIEAIAISNQRETALAWNVETGLPLGNAISWQCGRATEICHRLKPIAEDFRSKTGLPLAPLVSAGKWAWLLENEPAIKSLEDDGKLRLGTVDSWLIHQLTQGAVHATDLSNASRTGLLNLKSLAWDTGLLEVFGIPLNAMPALHPSSGYFGACTSLPSLEGVPILAAVGDSHGAMFGHRDYSSGTVKATYGTGTSLMALTQSLAADAPALARTIAWSIGSQTQFALEGNISMTGSAVQWVGEFLGFKNPAADAAALAATVREAGGVYFVPAMVGLGAPYWDAEARGTISGLSRSHTSAHLAHAAVDAIAYQVADVFFAMQEAAGVAIGPLHADGGATRNQALMQFQADILGCDVARSSDEELSALGAACLAGLALGWWNSLGDLESLPRKVDLFAPLMDQEKRDSLYHGWKLAVRRTRLAGEAIA